MITRRDCLCCTLAPQVRRPWRLHRAAIWEGGASRRLGLLGPPYTLIAQVILPVLAPATRVPTGPQSERTAPTAVQMILWSTDNRSHSCFDLRFFVWAIQDLNL
ncbi:MAG: hypothetical protein NVS3B26_19440 [Mycobacteriales bacterium]